MRVEVHELERTITEIVRRVQKDREIIEITSGDEVIATIIPSPTTLAEEEDLESFWAEGDEIASEVAAKWQGSPSAVDAIREVRREW